MALDADDPTYGNSAKIVYSIIEGQPYFSVDPKSGKYYFRVHFKDIETVAEGEFRETGSLPKRCYKQWCQKSREAPGVFAWMHLVLQKLWKGCFPSECIMMQMVSTCELLLAVEQLV